MILHHASRRAFAGALAGLTLMTACGKKAQTEDAVETQGPAAATPGQSMSGDDADRRDLALVRVVNAVPSSPEIAVRWDSGAVTPAVEYRKVSAYAPIEKNVATFQVRSGANGAFAPVATNRELLVDGHRYTIIVMPAANGTGLETRIVRDDVTGDSSQAHMRVINAAAGLGDVSVARTGGDKLFEGIDPGDEAGYKSVAPFTGALTIINDSSKATAATIKGVALARGVSYTVVVGRTARGGVDAFWFSDELKK